MGVLTQKKIRNVANLLLAAIQIIILLKFAYYFFYFQGTFQEYPYLVHNIRLIQSLPPPFLWLYASAIITGSILFRKRMCLHAIPTAIGLIFFIPLIIETANPQIISGDLTEYNRWFGLISAEVFGILYIIYSRYIFRKFFRIFNIKSNYLKAVLDSSQPHLLLVKVLSVMMNIYGLILIGGGFIEFYSEEQPSLFDYLDTGFLILLSYILIFVLVSVPKVIHFKLSRLAKSEMLSKYEKSNLTQDDAIAYVREMNQWMESEKPYLDCNLSLGELSEKLSLPGHILSEVLNGYLKQNYYEYINNYRIEEFKNLARRAENAKVTNLNLAYEAGFNSKTTFNTAFKKFTGQTPSEYRSAMI